MWVVGFSGTAFSCTLKVAVSRASFAFEAAPGARSNFMNYGLFLDPQEGPTAWYPSPVLDLGSIGLL